MFCKASENVGNVNNSLFCCLRDLVSGKKMLVFQMRTLKSVAAKSSKDLARQS